ncbi:24555_t:CDS:2 [Gigaspora rosea]|nr:24555_t:CDS:2 [Gigaspora rosea]
MKLPDFLHSALAQYLFLLSLCALITSTKSKIDYFKYTENTTDSRQPMVVNIQTYHDGTALVHITRFDPSLNESCSKSFGVFGNYTSGLEQRLRIRVIHLNGTVKEINPDLELNSLNYCAIRT